MTSFTFSVNGETVTLDVAVDTPLLWALRNMLQMRGTKFGCGRGCCGNPKSSASRLNVFPISGNRCRLCSRQP